MDMIWNMILFPMEQPILMEVLLMIAKIGNVEFDCVDAVQYWQRWIKQDHWWWLNNIICCELRLRNLYVRYALYMLMNDIVMNLM